MTEYYYSSNPTTAHDRHQFEFQLLDQTLKFTTDNGVFSKHTIDYGSRVLLEATLKTEFVAGPLLDVGCGYGPIGLALAKHFPDRTITMTDVNQRSLDLAQENAQNNQIDNVTVLTSDAFTAVTGQFAGIYTNPPIRAGKKVVNAILTEAKAHLLPGGQILAVLQKKQGAPSAKKLMTATYGNCQVLSKDKGYYILQSYQTD